MKFHTKNSEYAPCSWHQTQSNCKAMPSTYHWWSF